MIGLKIWSTNISSFPRLAELYDEGAIQYVEVYTVPGSDPKPLDTLRRVPIMLHAPNFNHNFNIADHNENYKEGISTVRDFSEHLGVKEIIFHPGYVVEDEKEDIKRSISSIMDLRDLDVILENVPRLGIDHKTDMLAADPNTFGVFLEQTGIRCCLDVGHAICSANSYGEDPKDFIKAFLAYKPVVIHLSDGTYSGKIDEHLHFGDGDYPLRELFAMLPKSKITLETPKKDFVNLSEDVMNINRLRSLM